MPDQADQLQPTDTLVSDRTVARMLEALSIRRHPDLFTPAEAAAYLHLDSEKSLETLRKDYGLAGHAGVSKGFMYWREDLDNVALRIVGRDGQQKKMRLAR